ncbi:MAG: linear amide C-N hydrolase, partial [Lentisphaeria bacterium]|nr:linear amide C-N hydrolase [Lentisphaeria bacterium]
MRKTGKKRLTIILILAFVAAVLLFVLGAWLKFGPFIVAARSIQKLQDGLYVMVYRGDYGLDEFLAQGGADSDSALAGYLMGYLSGGYLSQENIELKPGDYGCTTVCVKDKKGAVYFGRNFDWEKGRAMIVHTVPKNGYESLSTCCLDFLGFGDDYQPDGSMQERIQTLAAIYVPVDGMNEKGLVIADLMAGDNEETHQKTDKPDLTTTTAIRLLLDRAANVDEAIELLKQYDMNSSIGAAHHFAIADKSGKSVVVEYVNGEMLVAETNIVTNHYLADSPKKGVGDEDSHLRFDLMNQRIGPDFVLAGGFGVHGNWIVQRPFQEVRRLIAPVSQSQIKIRYPQG